MTLLTIKSSDRCEEAKDDHDHDAGHQVDEDLQEHDGDNKQDDDDDLPLIPTFMFEEPSPFILIELPYCSENEKLSKHFIRKIKGFIDIDCTVVIKWVTRKIRTLFSLKSKNPHRVCKIYQGVCNEI